MARVTTRRSLVRMAGLAAGVAAFTNVRPVGAAAGDPLIVGKVNDGGGKTTVLKSGPEEPTLEVIAGEWGKGGRGIAVEARGAAVVHGEIISDGVGSHVGINSGGNAISAWTSSRWSKYSTVAAYHRGGVALEGRSETRNWYGPGMYCFGQIVIQPGCGIAVVPKGSTDVDVKFDKNITLGEESIVLATPQKNAEVPVKRAYFLDEKTLRITLAEPAPAPTKIGYLVVKYS